MFDALRLVAQSNHSVTVSETATELDLPITSARRALITLRNVDAIASSYGESGFQTGVLIQELLHSLFSYYPLREASIPFLKRLAHSAGETASLGVSVGWYALRIAAVEGWKPVRTAGVGQVVPINKSLSGRLRLAFSDQKIIDEYMKFGPKDDFDGTPPIKKDDLPATLARIRRQGYSIDVSTTYPDVTTLSFPVRCPNGLVASMSLNGPSIQFKPTSEPQLETWGNIARELEELVRANSSLAYDPFGHLDPRKFRLDIPKN